MDEAERPDEIDARAVRLRCTSTLKISTELEALNDFRYHTIPQALLERKGKKAAYLEKTELVKLVDWKLKHGKYRLNLAKLVASNSVDDVRTATSTAFTAYEKNKSSPAVALASVQKLRGIGPATASLILAVYDPQNVPFFSDELFRWLKWEDKNQKGWDRPIKYNLKEYKELLGSVQEVRERLKVDEVTAEELERAAWCIAKDPTGRAGANHDAAEKKSSERPPSPNAKKPSVLKKRKRGSDD